MSNPKPANSETRVREIWGQTLQVAADPMLTLHQLPEASSEDVRDLARTLIKDNAANVTVARSAGASPDDNVRIAETLPRSDRVSTQEGRVPSEGTAAEGVAGRDSFTFKGMLGKGGMGEVLRARQGSLDREVAIKILRQDQSATDERMAAFLREALTTGALSHPNIVPVHLFGVDELGRLFIAMKQVEGQPWSELLSSWQIDPRDAEGQTGEDGLAFHLGIFLKVCDAVAFAHAKGIVHRDLKPENVMVGDYGEVLVMDWGLALDVSDGQRLGMGMSPEKASVVAGTPAYLAPEMALGVLKQVGAHSDIYLLGGILHEILTGQQPHQGRSLYETILHAADGKIEPIKPRPGLPRGARDLERILRKAMAAKPSERHASVHELQEDVRGYLAGQNRRLESDALAQEARGELTSLENEVQDLRVTSPYYPRCAEIIAKSQQALARWGFNPRAVRVRQEALALYAELAVRGKDWGLAESLLRDLSLSGSGGAALARPVHQRLLERRSEWQRREYIWRRTARSAVIGVMLAAAVGIYFGIKRYYDAIEPGKAIRSSGAANTPPEPELVPGEPRHEAPIIRTPKALDPKTPASAPIPVPLKSPATQATLLPMAEPLFVHTKPHEDLAPAVLPSSLTMSQAGRILVWNRAGSVWLARFRDPNQPGEAAVFYSSGSRVLLAAWADPHTVVIVKERGEVLVGTGSAHPWRRLATLKTDADMLVARRRNGRIQIAAARGNVCGLYDPERKAYSAEFRLQTPVTSLSFLPDESLMIVTQNNVEIHPSRGRARQYRIPREITRSVVARKGTHIIAVPKGAPRALNLLDMARARAQHRLRITEGEVSCLAITSHGDRIAAGSLRGEVVLLADEGLTVLARSAGHQEAVTAVALSPDATRLYSLAADGSLRVWDTSKWKLDATR